MGLVSHVIPLLSRCNSPAAAAALAADPHPAAEDAAAAAPACVIDITYKPD